MNLRKNQHNNLILYRKRMGFTQKRVALLLGHRDTSMISHYESGRALPPLMVALRFELIYRVPVAFLFPALYGELKQQIRAKEQSSPGSHQPPLF